MDFKNPATLSILLLVAVGGAVLFAAAYYGQFYGRDGSPFTDDSAKPVEVVTEFSTHLKQVSLMAPPDVVAKAMDEEYAAFVLPETLEAWKQNPQSAPGRLTSSPWPDHIEISTSTPTETGYRVDGVIVELTNDTAANGGRTSSYAVTVLLEKRAGEWKISSFERTAGVLPPTSMPATPHLGTYVCLPHKDQSGPQTMECAFGIRIDNGTHYALDFSTFASDTGMTIATGERIRVDGPLTPLSSIPANDRLRIYDVEGVIRVTGLSRL